MGWSGSIEAGCAPYESDIAADGTALKRSDAADAAETAAATAAAEAAAAGAAAAEAAGFFFAFLPLAADGRFGAARGVAEAEAAAPPAPGPCASIF
jgi:hypothetical protein